MSGDDAVENPKKINKLLLIDDEKGVVKALSMLLKAVGYEAEPFDKPAEALGYLATQSANGTLEIDLVLSDLRMPELDGIEVLQEIKSKYPGLPFVLMSGHASLEDQQRAFSLGADGFLPKPFSPDALHEIIGQIELAIAV